ncbi:hypothetical protein Cst_c16920 [Thermoclostridium stercorarium subsp. stercorarium DSM 8532]|uniref:Uncharacterized protein n=1 Tax=Thermoclostridium stercorarium (strain ATCC 35414 / DSM 8532 / NCIMB 11754) TaxID=1121335 RepID=L7VQM2_THES1|nr:hypothetical protein Cst_c16920 [Thermoclostridium stercorarium subsp. stercorarium DSM 8532]
MRLYGIGRKYRPFLIFVGYRFLHPGEGKIFDFIYKKCIDKPLLWLL